eukprot:14739648-Alexandrium_andersonii.AAC.1
MRPCQPAGRYTAHLHRDLANKARDEEENAPLLGSTPAPAPKPKASPAKSKSVLEMQYKAE